MLELSQQNKYGIGFVDAGQKESSTFVPNSKCGGVCGQGVNVVSFFIHITLASFSCSVTLFTTLHPTGQWFGLLGIHLLICSLFSTSIEIQIGWVIDFG